MTSKAFLSLVLFSLTLHGFTAEEEVEEVDRLLEELEKEIALEEQSDQEVEIVFEEDMVGPSSADVIAVAPPVAEVTLEEVNASEGAAAAEVVPVQSDASAPVVLAPQQMELPAVAEVVPVEQTEPAAVAEALKQELMPMQSETKTAEASVPEEQPPSVSAAPEQKKKFSSLLGSQRKPKVTPQGPQPKKLPSEPGAPPAAKKIKPHFVGSKPRPSSGNRKKSTKIPMKIRRESRTIPLGDPQKKEGEAAQPSSSRGTLITPEVIAQLTADNAPQVRTVPKREEKRGDPNAYLTAEWLYWRTRQGAMEYAVAHAEEASTTLTHAVSKEIQLPWTSGLRAGVGIHLPQDRWDIFFNYTWIAPEHTSSAHGFLFPSLLYQGHLSVAHVEEAKAYLRVRFQTLDVEIGRLYAATESLRLRPHIGIKGAWIDQDLHIDYMGGGLLAADPASVRARNDFKGGGVRCGVNSQWVLGQGFSLFGNFSAALLAGFYHLKHSQEQLHAAVIDVKSGLHEVSPVLQLLLGAGWEKHFSSCDLGLSAGFESLYFWQQNLFEQFVDSALPLFVRADSALAFYGLTLQARLTF